MILFRSVLVGAIAGCAGGAIVHALLWAPVMFILAISDATLAEACQTTVRQRTLPEA